MAIVIKMELWPHGDESRASSLGHAVIHNTGGTAELGNYEVLLYGWHGRVWKRGKVEGHPRKRLGPWDLLLRALVSVVGSRNTVASRVASAWISAALKRAEESNG